MRKRIGITLGDPAGIGPEIIRTALASGKLPDADYRLLGAIRRALVRQTHSDSAREAQAALEESARLAIAHEIDAVVTGPIHKARMYEIGFEFPGQTEFFAARCGVENFAMLLTGAGSHRRSRDHPYSIRRRDKKTAARRDCAGWPVVGRFSHQARA